MNPIVTEKDVIVRFQCQTLKIKQNVKLCKTRHHIASYLGLHKCVASDQQEYTALMCYCVYHVKLKDYFLQPLLLTHNHDYQEFAPITRQHATELDSQVKTPIICEEFISIM